MFLLCRNALPPCDLAYEVAADACDDYCRLGESTISECMKRFVIVVWACFEGTYLR